MMDTVGSYLRFREDKFFSTYRIIGIINKPAVFWKFIDIALKCVNNIWKIVIIIQMIFFYICQYDDLGIKRQKITLMFTRFRNQKLFIISETRIAFPFFDERSNNNCRIKPSPLRKQTNECCCC